MSELSKCSDCGGFGKGLVRSTSGLCTHCIRKKKLFFDPDQSPYCKEAYVDISPNADGKILKRVKREGTPGEFLEEGCPVDIQYIARLDDGTIVDTTRDYVDGKHIGGTDDPYNFIIGRGKVIKGLDLGIMSMAKNEIAEFIFHPDYAYGPAGLPPKIEPNMTLFYEIELLSFKNALPPFPTEAELAESKRQQELEAQRMLKENPPPTVRERIDGSLAEKEKGNALLKDAKYEEAQKQYDSGFVHLYFSKEEWEYALNDEERKLVNEAKLPLHLNRALCKIKLNKFHDALWDCDCAIEIDTSNTKAHFRRGNVYLEKLKEELEKEKKKEFWIIEKAKEYAKECEKSLGKAQSLSENKKDGQLVARMNEYNQANKLLRKYEKNYHEEQKRLYKDKIFRRLSETKDNNNQVENGSGNTHEAVEEDDIYADMPDLE